MPVQFTTLTDTDAPVDVTLLEPERVLSVLVQLVAAQANSKQQNNGWGCWDTADSTADLYGDVRMLIRDAASATLPEHAQSVHDDLEVAITARLDQNRAWINLPSRLDKVLTQLSHPVQVTLDAEFAYPSTCAALLDAFKILNHPRLTFVLSGNALDFIHAAGVGYGSQERAKHNAARLGIYA